MFWLDYTLFEIICLLGLPVDLQYLPEDKKREEDPDIRKMLIETLLLVSEFLSLKQTSLIW